MEFKNGTTKKPLTYADFEMVSADNKRILLRYVGNLWDDVFFEASQMVLDTTPSLENNYEMLISKTILHIGFSIQLNAVRPYADLRIKTRTGKTLLRRYALSSTDTELANILDRFFEEGCQGILPEFASHFTRFYMSWRQAKIS